VLRLNYDNRGEYLGEFLSEDLILVVSSKGEYYTSNFDLSNHYEKDIMIIEKFDSNKVWSVALYDAEQKYYYLKRFQLEPSQKKQNFLGDNPESRLMLMSDVDYPRFEVVFGGNDAFREALVVDVEEFIGVKSFKAKGKRLTTFEVEAINELEPVRFAPTRDNNGNENVPNSEEVDNQDVEEDVSAEDVEVEKSEVNEEKIVKSKKKKTIQPTENDSTLPDDNIVDQSRLLDDITGQLTLF